MNHYKDLIRLGTPVVVGQIGNLVLNFADTFMIGHHSTLELAAASFVNNIFVLSVIFAIGFNFAITPIVGPFIGRNEQERVGRVVSAANYANLLLVVVLVLAMVGFYFSLPYLGQPSELLSLMRPYLFVNIISLPFVVFGCQFKQFFDTIGKTKVSMYVLVVGNLLNILGNYLLIYGNWGLPELGLLGAGISTVISRIVMLVAFLMVFTGKRDYAVFNKGVRTAKKAEVIAYIRRLNTLGWLSAFQATIECGAFSLVAIFVGWTGTKPLAAHQIMITISLFFYNVYLGIATAISIRVSHFVGMFERRAIVDVTRSGFIIIIGIATTVAIPVFLLRHQVGSVFTSDEHVGELVAMTIIPLILYQLSDAFQCCLANALRGLGEMRQMMYAAFFSYFVVSLPLSWFLGIFCGFGIVGIWSAFPICLTIAGILYYIIFVRSLKK
ncbi:MAG: MATE family efflux transporter [Prevotella sp.]